MAQMAALLQAQRSMIAANDARLTPANVTPPTSSKENDLENQRRQDKMIELLVKIEKNTAGAIGGAAKSAKPAGGDFGIGALGTMLAVALGAIVGYIKGYVTLLGKLAKVLLPEKWIAAIKTGFDAIVDFFGKIGDLIAKGFAKIKSLFVFDEGSTIGKMITSLKDGISKFFAPIAKGADLIKDGSAAVGRGIDFVMDMVGKVKSFFSTVAAWGDEFMKIFGGAVKIFSKLAIPFTVIMTLWDTVKGFIAGFEDGGIIGGVMGAVKGFFNSLIFAPLDMLKNAIAWVLGVFGFDKAEEALKSFSFETMFSNMIDNLAKPFIWIRDKAIELWESFNWDELWGKITTFITESIGSVVTGFGKLKDGIIEWWNGWSISDVITSISNQVTEISSAISKWFKDKLDKVKSFFGFGDDKKEETAPVKPAQRQEPRVVDYSGVVSPEESPSAAVVQEPPKTGSTMSKLKGFFGFKEKPAPAVEAAPAPATAAPTTSPVVAVPAVAKPVEPPRTATQVSSASAASEEAKIRAMTPQVRSSNNAVVNAPVNNNQNNYIKANIRNQESSLERYERDRNRFAF
jgi:hypothetical protein